MNGKGPEYRPVNGDKFRSNYDTIFGDDDEDQDEGRHQWYDADKEEWVSESPEPAEVPLGSPWTSKELPSRAMSCHPIQAKQFNEDSKRSGGSAEIYHPVTGKASFSSSSQRRREMKRRGTEDLEAWY